jgi:hypothetical protein
MSSQRKGIITYEKTTLWHIKLVTWHCNAKCIISKNKIICSAIAPNISMKKTVVSIYNCKENNAVYSLVTKEFGTTHSWMPYSHMFNVYGFTTIQKIPSFFKHFLYIIPLSFPSRNL